MAWRLARSLERLRHECNLIAPERSKRSDGTIGDDDHQNRSSDHNPWVRDGFMGVVTALDITHDPENGMDCRRLARVAAKDPRTKYVIWNRQISNPDILDGQWRPYRGVNPHTRHCHISVDSSKSLYDDESSWKLAGRGRGVEDDVVTPNSQRHHVRGWQHLINRAIEERDVKHDQVKVDGLHGPKTAAAWEAVQRSANIQPHPNLELGDVIVLGGYGVPIDTDD